MMQRTREHVPRLLLTGAMAAAGAFFIYALIGRLGDLRTAGADIRVGYLALATACIAIAVVGFGFVWTELLGRLAGRDGSARGPLLKAFAYSWLARYIPGTVPSLLMRVEMAQRLGYRRTTLAASLAYENVLQLGTALVVSFVLLLGGMGGHVGAFWVYGLALIPLTGAVVLVHPGVLVPCANRVARVLRRPEISSESVLPARAMLRAVVLYGLFVAINGVGFYCALNAVTPVGLQSLPAAIGIYNLAGVIGILAVVTPSGLGVREGIIVGLLSLQFPLEVAAAAAIIARLAAIPADGLPAALFFAADNVRRG